jgi:hypothetical protein
METTTLETIPDFSEAMRMVFEVKEPPRLTPINFVLQNPVNLVNALKVAAYVNDEVPFYINGSEVKIKTLDLAEVSMVEVVFRPETLRTPDDIPVSFRIRIDDLISMFPKLKPKEDRYSYVEFNVEAEYVEVKMQDKGVSFKVPIWELTPEPKELPDPKVFFDAKVRPLNIKDLVDAIEQLKSISDCVVLSVDDKLRISSKGEILEKTIEIPCLEITGGNAKASYDIKRLGILKTLSRLGGDVRMEFSSNLPIWIYAEYPYSDAPLDHISYFQAPRLERTD